MNEETEDDYDTEENLEDGDEEALDSADVDK
jgi:hypothetical protein